MKRNFVSLFVLLVLFLSTCVPQPAAPATPAATDPNAAIVAAAQEVLAQALGRPAGAFELISIEPVEWPDSCLGVQTPDVMCAQVVTPGNRVVLRVDGVEYELHTNALGTEVVLASGPEAQAEDAAVVWQAQDEGCSMLVVNADSLAYGVCGADLKTGVFASDQRPDELAYFVQTFAAFQAETPAGQVTFRGQGAQEALPAEQRAMAEWARLVFQESKAGRGSAAQGLALGWHREGGIAGFCDDLALYVSGFAYKTTCSQLQPSEPGSQFLSADQLEQLYAWVDQYQSTEYEHDDGIAADGMLIRMVFGGNGDEQAGDDAIEAMQNFASQVFSQIHQR